MFKFPGVYGLITYCLLSWLLLSRRCWGANFAVTSETTGSSCILDFLKRFIYLRPKKTNLPTHLSFGRASGTFNFYALKLGIISFTLIYTITSTEISSPKVLGTCSQQCKSNCCSVYNTCKRTSYSVGRVI